VTPLAFLFLLITESFSIAGQIFFKRAMSMPDEAPRAKFLGVFGAGIFVKAVAFFLWLGLLKRFNLSQLYVFEGLAPIMLVLAAWIFLREKMTLNLWLGMLLISGGLVLVSAS